MPNHLKFSRMSRSARRGGLTLFELLISLGLTLLLLGSVGATLSIFLETQTAGREQVERAQLVRALYRRLGDDIRCTVFRVPLMSEEDAENAELSAAEAADFEAQLAEAQAGSDPDAAELEPVDPEAAITSATVGLFGDSEKLVLHINRPRRTAYAVDSTDEGDTIGSYTDESYLRSVTWFLADEGRAGLSADVANRDLRLEGGSVTRGLARLENEYESAQFAEFETDPATLVEAAEILAPEVTDLQFRYFDGIDWVTEWDSEQMERLPNAVEVTLQLEPPRTTANVYLNRGSATDSDAEGFTFRIVIALPLAPAPLTEVEL